MDLEDRRVHRETPKIKCHERKHTRHGTIAHQWKTSGKVRCPDKGTMKIRKPAQINPLMTILMSPRPGLNQSPATGDVICMERLPLTTYGTVVLELPNDFHYKPAVKKSTGVRKIATRKCVVPDPNKLKLSLRWQM